MSSSETSNKSSMKCLFSNNLPVDSNDLLNEWFDSNVWLKGMCIFRLIFESAYFGRSANFRGKTVILNKRFLVFKTQGLYCNELKVQSCKWCNNKYMIASTQKKNTDIFAFLVALVFKLLSHKSLFINRKDNSNC